MAAITAAIIFAVQRNYVAVTTYCNVKEKYGIGTKSNPSDNGKVEETNNKTESAAEEEEIPWPEADEAMTDGGLF